MKQYSQRFASLLVLPAMLFPLAALGHTGTGLFHGFQSGLIHPFSGLDHLAAMIAVGLWAAQLGGRAIWLVPASFVTAMTASGLLAMSFIQVPFFEGGITISLLMLGLLVAATIRLPLWMSASIVAVFAVFYGYAHGAELPQNADAVWYAAGFVFSTASLHLLGIALARLSMKHNPAHWPRFAGFTVLLCGLISWSAG